MESVTTNQETRELFESTVVGNTYDIFFLGSGDRRVVGRKTESQYPAPGPGVRTKSCLVEPEMVLGVPVGEQVDADGVTIRYRPLPAAEKKRLFAAAVRDPRCPLTYPFAPHSRRPELRRFRSGAAGWGVTPERAQRLDDQELVLRGYTAHWLRKAGIAHRLREAGITDGLAYDPGCSTGTFLEGVGAQLPMLRTVGQDLGEEMVEYASTRLDEVHHGDSIRPAIPGESADLVFCRHLNIFVVDQEKARALFLAAAGTCKIGGYVVVIGHTPVLLDDEWFENQGVSIEQRTGATISGHALFQYYVLRKTSRTPEII